ncbi:MAG: hypothetical protein AVDCRST_MAG23-149, partial [uncultured Sphingosinicella sp.]
VNYQHHLKHGFWRKRAQAAMEPPHGQIGTQGYAGGWLHPLRRHHGRRGDRRLPVRRAERRPACRRRARRGDRLGALAAGPALHRL